MEEQQNRTLSDEKHLSDTEKANIRLEQAFYGEAEAETPESFVFMDADSAALRNRNQS